MDYSNDFRVVYDEDIESCTIRFRCFDTPNSITVYNADCPDYQLEELLSEARRTCLRLHALWSFSIEGSDIARLNEPGKQVEVSEETAALIAAMQEFNAKEPAFDFTIGPASFLWKRAKRLPEPYELADALRFVGADKVHVVGRMVLKEHERMRVDVGGAAKGYAADMLAGFLRSAGIESADIDLGGNLFMLGEHPEGRPWRVSVRIPGGMQVKPIILSVLDQSVVTSGSYERFVEIDGKRYTHIIDARTGWPAETDVVSVTVVGASSLEADMLATTASILGSSELGRLAASHPGYGFTAIREDGAVLYKR